MKKITAWILCILLVFSIAGIWAYWAASVTIQPDEQGSVITVGTTEHAETTIDLWEAIPGFNDNLILVPTGGAIKGTTAPQDSTVVEFVLFPIVVFWDKLDGEGGYDASLEGLVGQFLFEIVVELLENDNSLILVDDPNFLAAKESISARLLVVGNEQDSNKWDDTFEKFESNLRTEVASIADEDDRAYTYSADINQAITDLKIAEIVKNYNLYYYQFVQLALLVYLDPPTALTIEHIINAPVRVKISISLDDKHEIFTNNEEQGG